MRVERIICHVVVFSILMAGVHMFALQGKFQVDLTDVSRKFVLVQNFNYMRFFSSS